MADTMKTQKLPKRKRAGVYDHNIVKLVFSSKDELIPEKQRGKVIDALLNGKAG